jgi:predicted NUDIX family NTP pyrophosphohydrolase
MPELSAGLILYRWQNDATEVLLIHPGGPYWARRDDGVWSIPKGRYRADENPLSAARREFAEETGCQPPLHAIELGHFRQPSGKVVSAWAAERNFDLADFRSNSFSIEWPPRSGKIREFPEADRGGWFRPEAALIKILKGQIPIVRALLRRLHNEDLQV